VWFIPQKKSTSEAPKTPEEIKIGAILPLTGKVAVFGEWIKNGMEMALECARKEKNGNMVVIYEDSRMDAKTGVLALNKLLTVDKVDIVVSAMSKVSIPLIPIVEKKQMPLILLDVTYPQITQKGKMLFRHFIQSDREASILAKHAITYLKIKRAGVLYVNDEAGLGAKEAFLRVFSKLGGEISQVENFDFTATDMKSQISKIMSAQVDAIYLFGNGPSWAVCLKQIRELGYSGKILTNTAMYIPNFRKLAGDSAIEGVYFTYPYMDLKYKSVQRFVERYHKRYGFYPPIESAYAWDIIHWIAKAQSLKGKSIYEKLLSVKELSSAFGEIQIPEDRDIKTKVGIGVVKDGNITTLSVQE